MTAELPAHVLACDETDRPHLADRVTGRAVRWTLLTRAGYENYGFLSADPVATVDASPRTPAAWLARWCGEELGYPVTLHPDPGGVVKLARTGVLYGVNPR